MEEGGFLAGVLVFGLIEVSKIFALDMLFAQRIDGSSVIFC